MNIEIISDASLTRYLDFLTNEEVFAIRDGRFTGFGAFDPAQNRAAGALVALVLQEHILIKRFFAAPEYDEEEITQELLDAVCNLPDDLKMPLLVYGTEEELNENLLKKLGFDAEESDYSYMEGTLGHFRRFPLAPERGIYDLRPLEEVPPRIVLSLAMKKRKNMSDWMRDEFPDVLWFSEASPICFKEKQIAAALLIEEDDPCITVQMMFGDDNRAIFYCFSALRDVLAGEFAAEERVRFLLYKQEGKEAISELITDAEEKKIRIYKRMEGAAHEFIGS